MGVAAQKWLALTVDILAYELIHRHDEEMLSHAAHRWIDNHPIAARVAIVSAGALVTVHLAKLIEPTADPLSKEFFLRQRVPGLVAPR